MSTTTSPAPTTPSAPAFPSVAAPAARLRLAGSWLLYQLGLGAVVGSIGVGALTGLDAAAGLTPLGDMVLVGLLGFLITFAGEGLALLLRLVVVTGLRAAKVAGVTPKSGTRGASALGRLAGAAVLLLGHVYFPNSFLKFINPTPIALVVLPTIVAAWLLVALARRPGASARARWAGLGLAAVVSVGALAWLLLPGTASYVARAPLAAALPQAPLTAANPGAPGRYTVQTLSYGSGLDRGKPQYGAQAALTTTPVDGSKIFLGFGPADGFLAARRGYDRTQLPLNALVWYPVGAGPFPLVLIVHGAHNAFEPSEPGYAYLGEHLASQGYIVASVDENFLNGSALGDGEGREVAARAWLLLKHLQAWRAWNAEAGNPFYGKVDLDRIALVGHSRGGEAVIDAALLNTHTMGAIISSDFDFNIRAVVSIAPSDWFFQPSGQLLALKDTSFLVLAGGHDADTYSFYGLSAYNRARLSAGTDQFKALVYLYQANHGQFNTVWGDHDRGYLGSLALNRAPLLTAADQQAAAQLYLTGFLEAALRGRAEYRALFYDPAAASAWLPVNVGLITTDYQDATFAPLATFEVVRQRNGTEVLGGTALAEGMTIWDSQALLLRDGQRLQDNTALHLAWDATQPGAYQLNLASDTAADWQITAADALTFQLMPVSAAPYAVTVELTDAAGATATLPLTRFGALLPPLPARLVKADWLLGAAGFNLTLAQPAELVPQVYDLPLAAFNAANPAFYPGELSQIRLTFTGDTGGELYLDELGLRRGS